MSLKPRSIASQKHSAAAREFRASSLDLADARRALSGFMEGQWTQHALAKKRQEAYGFEQFSSPDFRRAIVHPDPKTILDPLRIWFWLDALVLHQSPAQATFPLPQHHWIFLPCRSVRETHELEVHVEERSIEQTYQESRLVHVFEASSHFEAMQKYNVFNGWGPYRTDQAWDFEPYPDSWKEEQDANQENWRSLHQRWLGGV